MAELEYLEWVKSLDFEALQHPDWEFAKRALAPGVSWDGECYVHSTATSRTRISPKFLQNYMEGIVMLTERPEAFFSHPMT